VAYSNFSLFYYLFSRRKEECAVKKYVSPELEALDFVVEEVIAGEEGSLHGINDATGDCILW
jgi:hypothetical protein